MMMTRSLKRKQREDVEVHIRKHVEEKKKKKKQSIPEEEEEMQSFIRVGDAVDLSQILFTQERDYLIKYKDNKVVKHKHLAGKVVVLHFVSLVNNRDINRWDFFATDLADVYNNLEPKGGFEVVLVAVRDGMSCSYPGKPRLKYSTPYERYEEIFSTMPWTAIPFSDVKSRKRLERRFGISGNTVVDEVPISVVIDPRGMVVQTRACHVFSRYGAAGYPFTSERLKFLDSEDSVAKKQLSVSTLLASPERDYVITNKGDQVPVHKLEDKVVCLFFLTSKSHNFITWKLKKIYKELAKNKEDFEVVLVYLLPISSDTYEDEFWKTFGTMPWLAIPFKDTNCTKKLVRIFEYPLCEPGPDPVSGLVIIGPHGKFIEPFGVNILMRYGIPAYPFTRFSAVKLKLENAKDVKPEMFWDLDAVFRQENGSQVRFSQIAGKRIIVLFQICYDISEHALRKLKALYIQMKGTHDEFEVIHIRDKSEKVAAAIPWLTHTPFEKASDADQLMCRIFDGGCDGIIAFDCDGRVVRMTSSVSAIGKMDFPFYSCNDMEAEVLEEVEDCLREPLQALSCWLRYE